MIILNALSANMLKPPFSIRGEEVSVSEAMEMAKGASSAVGHVDTAAVFSTVLGVVVPFNRANVSLKSGDVALLGQYVGPRLPEGATSLPEGAKIVWLKITVE